MNFHSEYGEDQWLWNHYEDYFKVPHFYVDAGCGGPVHGSNTSWLRSMGWKGLNIDGDKSWEDQWNGDFVHAVLHTDPAVCFESNPVACLSRVGIGEPNVMTRRLDDILVERSVDRIGFMSVDVEGQELRVLESMNKFPNWPPFIISEFRTHGIGVDYGVRDLLLSFSYKVIHETYANLIYLNENYLPPAR